jgi:hypothetical protein
MINGLGGVKVIIIVIVSDDEKGCCRFYTKKLEFDVRIEDICPHAWQALGWSCPKEFWVDNKSLLVPDKKRMSKEVYEVTKSNIGSETGII